MHILKSILVVLILILPIYLPKCLLAYKLQKECDIESKKSFIPFYNSIQIANNILGDNWSPVIKIKYILFIIVYLICTFLRVKYVDLIQFQTFVSGIMLINITLFILVTLVADFVTAKRLDASVVTSVLIILLNPVGVYMLSQNVEPFFKKYRDELEGTFND